MAIAERVELPLEVEEFLSWLVTERGRAANTVVAYRRDLGSYTGWLAAHGHDLASVDTATLVDFVAERRASGAASSVAAAAGGGAYAAPLPGHRGRAGGRSDR